MTRVACFSQSMSLCVYGRDVMGIDMNSLKVMNEAARYGLLEGVKWLNMLKCRHASSTPICTTTSTATVCDLCDHRTLNAAAKGGHLAVLQWIKSCNPSLPWDPLDQFVDDGLCAVAALNGHLHVIQWARAQDPPAPWNESTCFCAASHNHIHVLQWARAQGCPWDEQTCARSAGSGHLDIIQWARAQDPPAPWDTSTCFCAASHNHIHVLQWARAQGCPWDERTCLHAAQNGNTGIVEWALAQNPPCPMDVWTCEWVDNGYRLDRITFEDMKALWSLVKLRGADFGFDEYDEENMMFPYVYALVDRMRIARQYDPKATLGYDSHEDTDGLRASHQRCSQCINGICFFVEERIIEFYSIWVINNDGIETCWPKWDIESCPFLLVDLVNN